ncbi:integrase, catalytic region, zinc finger, CCHC-type containing protein [Tanacetum coccineum]
MVLKQKVNIKPINYAELNRLSEDFGKRFVPQQELSDEQALHPNNDQSASSPVKIEAPRELPKNSYIAMNDSLNYVEMCNKCLELKAELIKQHNMVEKDEYNKLSKRFSELEEHCISLEIAMQLNKEFFQKNNSFLNQTEPSFDQLFNLNNLKSELQEKYTTIEKLKANVKHLNKTSTTNSVKKDIDEIETINIELEHRVTKLIAENEHLKQTYKQLYDSIKPSRVQAKEHAESLVNQLNQKSVEITDLNAQLQEKVFVITTLKNDLRKFKGKDIVDNAAQASNATTIAPGMYKLDLVTLAPKDKNNRETHIYYLKHTMEQAAILREIVEQAKSLNPLDSASYSACKYVKLIQELLGYVRDTCPDIHKPRLKRSTKSSSSMFDARHELCFLDIVSDMNASSKSKSVKKTKKKEEWKPTGKMFTKIGYIWRPTGRNFTLVRNACPLTKITATNKVPLREPIPLKVVVQESVVTKVYTRRPKVSKTNGSNSKPKIAKSMISNKMEPDIGTEFVNQTLQDYYEQVGISHETSVARTPQQNGVVERKPDLSYLHVFGALCYPNNDNEDLGKLQAKADIDDWEHLFQPMFDEYFNPSPIAVSLVPVADAPRAVNLADSPVSTSIDQDAPSTKSSKTPHFHDDPFHESLHKDSTSQGLSSNMRPMYTPFESLGRWTKDHPIENVIGDPSRSVCPPESNYRLMPCGGILMHS